MYSAAQQAKYYSRLEEEQKRVDELLTALGIPPLMDATCEADDVIADLARTAQPLGFNTAIWSDDSVSCPTGDRVCSG